MNRRGFLAALVAAAGCRPQEAPKKEGSKAQAGATLERSKIPRVAMLFYGPRATTTVSSSTAIGVSPIVLFRERLGELGYVEGTNILLEERYADGDPQRLQQLAQEIVAGNPDVIVAIAAAATAAVRQATSTIPIVMAHAGDPVGAGWVKTLAHPGGNVTGSTSQVPDLGSKQVELLRELIPGLTRLGVLANPTNSGTPLLLTNVKEAARRFKIDLTVAEVARAEDFDAALRLLGGARLDALYVMVEPMIYLNRARVLDFAAANRLPASYDVGREIVRQGGLISFGPVLQTHYALAAEYVDKVLKGARPGDLPIQQPTQFALVAAIERCVTQNRTMLQRFGEPVKFAAFVVSAQIPWRCRSLPRARACASPRRRTPIAARSSTPRRTSSRLAASKARAWMRSHPGRARRAR